MRKRIKETVKLILGWIFVVLGVIGLFLPVLQGILFLMIGLVLLSGKCRWVKQILKKLKDKYPKIYLKAKITKDKSAQYMRKLFGKY